MKNSKKIILFDNDGVLVETEHLYYKANKVILKNEFGLDLGFDRYMQIMTKGGSAWEVAIENGINEKLIDIAREKRDTLYQEYITTEDIVIDGVEEVLKELSKRFKMAIVTTSRRVDFELIHENRGIMKFMEFALCVEDYKRAKPFPDPYLKAVEMFKAQKNECIIIEDSQRGLTSAFNANIDCITVENQFTKTQDFSKAIRKVARLKELIDIL